MSDLTGNVAIVTGAGAGIGQSISLRLAREGATVIVADVDEQAAAKTVALIETDAGQAAYVHVDVAVDAEVQALVAFAESRFGGLDVLVNNAGIAPWPFFPDAEPAHWGRTLDVNLRGPMLGIHFASEAMGRHGGGAIVNIASIAGIGYHPYDVPEYAASKAGLIRLTASLGGLKEERSIRVNCICPGWVETPAVQRSLAAMSQEERAAFSFPPPAVLIQPEEIAEAVMMFIRDQTLAGRVLVWPDGEPWYLVPLDAGPGERG